MFSWFTSWSSTTTSLSTSPTFRFHTPIPLYLFLFLSSLCTTNAFTWRWTSSPTQCEETSVIWDGGTPPYKILLLPLGFKPQGVETRVIFERTIDTGNQEGFIFPFPADSQFVAVMSDATGFGTGGTSPILTVNSGNSSSCIPRTPSEPEFYLYLSSTSLKQCGSVHISWDRPASPPVTVYGVIPQGQSFDLNAASKVGSGTGFDWTVNIKSGTPFFFVAGDRNGSGKGGSTDVQSIGGGSSRCIDANSPSATADSGIGSVGQLPNASGTPTPTSSGTNDPSGSGNNNGSGNGNGNNTGDNNNNGDGNGNGNGNGNGTGGTNDGSGGGTVHGPLDPTSTANGANNGSRHGPNLPLILGLVITLTGLGILIGLAVLFYKRRKREQERRDNQRARLLPTGDVSEIHLPREHADLPHPRPPFSNRAWPGGSIENLGSALRATPFIWPIGGRDSASPRDPATGTSTARRPGIESRSTSSSGMLRRLRNNRLGSGIGFPFTGSGGYQSLGDDSTPSSNLQNTNTTTNSSGFGSGFAAGHNTSQSNDSSASAVHKSPLPASYLQHVSQNSHGSDGSRLDHASPIRMSIDNARSDSALVTSGEHHTLTRPGPAPLGPRPAPGSSRPSYGRVDTGGSIWEVPPTYDSLRRQQARQG